MDSSEKISDHAANFKSLRFEPFYLLDVSLRNDVLNCLSVDVFSGASAWEMLNAANGCAMRVFLGSQTGETGLIDAIVLQTDQQDLRGDASTPASAGSVRDEGAGCDRSPRQSHRGH